jgi:FkbM family methyltransferase
MFGFEVHGTGFIQSIKKTSFKEDSFLIQKEIIGKKKSVTIFDIGANRGQVTQKYLELFPNAIIYAFEPFPESFNILRNRFLDNSSVHLIQKAVSSESGNKEFFVNKNVDTNSLLKPQKTGLSSDEQVRNVHKIKVEGLILDNFCHFNRIEHIDILKMDIQGGEYDALKGLHKALEKSAIDLIYTETYFLEQYENQPLFHDISKLLLKYDYRLQDIYNPIYGNGKIAWADVIFVKNKKKL